MKVVVLGGGSTGEHFVGALRRLDADAEITLVESRLVGGECSYYACMPTKTMLRASELSSSLDRAPAGSTRWFASVPLAGSTRSSSPVPSHTGAVAGSSDNSSRRARCNIDTIAPF